jgi:dienelactone hydrolase
MRRIVFVLGSRAPLGAVVITALLLLDTAGGMAGEKVQIKWNGNYPHNNERTFSESYRLGWSKNFMNGFPEENGVVQRDGFLAAEVFKPKGFGPFRFVVLMHGCGGMDSVATQWVKTYSQFLGHEGVGSIAVDSFTSRKVRDVCGKATEGDWARRRSEDAYSALEFLATTGYADMSRVYLVGRSNGGATVLMAIETIMSVHHPYKFVAGFSLVPACRAKVSAEFSAPLIVFIAGDDDANDPAFCIKMGETKRKDGHPPLKVIVYEGASHGYMDNLPFRYFHGWRMGYSHSAAEDTRRQIVEHLKSDNWERGVEQK